MRVFLAGATGAIGIRLIPKLVQAGHEVTGTTRSAAKTDEIERAGARPVVADALDPAAITEAVTAARPQVVIHELTAIPPRFNPKHLDRAFALTNRLRTEGTRNLLQAARQAGARRFLAQSYAGWPF